MGYHFHHLAVDEEEELQRRVSDKVLVTWLLKLLLRYRSMFIIALTLMVAAAGLGLVSPYLLKLAIDDYIIRSDLAGLNTLVALYVLVMVLTWVVASLRLYATSWIGQRIIVDLRMRLFSHLQNLSLSFFDRREAGRIMSRVTNDVDTLNQMVSMGLINVLSDVLIVGGILAIMFWMDLRLSLLMMTIIPLLVLLTIRFAKRARVLFRKTRRTISSVTSALQEGISGIKVTQSLTREEGNVRRFDQVNVENLQANVESARLSAIVGPLVELVAALGTCMILWYGGFTVMEGSLSFGVLVAFMAYQTRFFSPILDLTMFYNNIQSTLAASERIYELLSNKPEVLEKDHPIELPKAMGEVRFENVSFGYDPRQLVLKDVNLDVKPGEAVALVGPTGAGKTTLVNLVCRFYDPQTGRITVDGYDVKDVSFESLRGQMGIVLQDSVLFSGTVKENIRYGRVTAPDEEVIDAAKAVGAHEFIAELPEGYETDVRERGGRLSMGQRQLICFARALLADPRVLILDEATSSIDAYTEQLIQRALRKLLEGRTAFIIAHRLSTVRNADRIVVLNDGKIVEMGRHEELLEKDGLYHRLYEMQFKQLEAEAVRGSGATS